MQKNPTGLRDVVWQAEAGRQAPFMVFPAGDGFDSPGGAFSEKRMNIDELTIGQAKQLAALLSKPADSAASPYDPWVGKNIAIRGVTMIDVGRLVKVYPQELLIEDASWIPETDRWAQFLEDGSHKECEPYPNGRVVIGRGSICEVAEWGHALPRTQK